MRRLRTGLELATVAVLVGLVVAAGSASSGCKDQRPIALDLGADLAAAPDLSLLPQVTRVGIKTITCCLVPSSSNEQVLYLARTIPAASTTRGGETSAYGELHVASVHGGDFLLAARVPVGGYAFAPGDDSAIFVSQNGDGSHGLSFASLSRPVLAKPTITTVVATGMQDDPLSSQSFVTDSGRYLIAGVRPPTAARYADLHVIDIAGARDALQVGSGAFAYFEFVSADDVMYYQHLDASTVPGTPSTQGLYSLPLPTAIAGGATATSIDVRTDTFALRADGRTVLYTRTNGELVVYDGNTLARRVLASGVIDFVVGGGSEGPVAYLASDGSVHVVALDGTARAATAAGATQVDSELRLSPDGEHAYYFANYHRQERSGDLWHLDASGEGAGTVRLIAPRVSSRSLRFEGDRLLAFTNATATGEIGDLNAMALDGTGATLLGRAVITTSLLVSDALRVQATDAALDGAHVTPETRPIDGSRALLGTLALASGLGTDARSLGARVHASTLRLADSGQTLLFVDGAEWDATAFNYVGTLRAVSSGGVELLLPGGPLPRATEISRAVDRSFFVNVTGTQAPDGAGVYFVKY